MSQNETSGVPSVAVVGMGCRFPGARGVDAYWALLEENRDAITAIPEDRFDVSPHYGGEPGTPGRTVSRHGGFIDDVYAFDAPFFRLSPREARTMDPQQRLLLHVVWEALEQAGIRPSSLAGSRGGVFVGQATAEYAEATGDAAVADVRAMAGGRLRAVTAGRLSYALDLRGPSVVLDTACSSSLVAVHSARQSLLTGESDLAVAAGVNVLLSPTDSIAYSQGHMLAPDGRCKFGSADADGFVRSEGVAAVILKRLPDALRDGDPVLAVLHGSAVTNDGQGSGLLLQPAVTGQVAMLREACRAAGIEPSRLDYVEAHGTGTVVGDAVELRALAEFYGSAGPVDRPLLVGSVKSNIGHTEAAAGLAGLVKAVLAVRHRRVPASLHTDNPNELLRDGDLPVRVVTENTPLETGGRPAVVGVSSFGISGTNAHVVIGEYVPDTASATSPATSATPAIPAVPGTDDPTAGASAPHLLVLSARSERSLRGLAARYAAHLEPGGAGRTTPLRDICRTAALHRDPHPYRLWAVGTTHEELAAVLRTLADGGESPHGGTAEAAFGADREPVFVFPGQGSQWAGMARDLLRSSAAFRSAMEACDAAVQQESGWSVRELLTRDDDVFPDTVDRVQPALWAVQVSLAAHWRAMGVEPALCLGHSMGEAAAAYVSGALSLRDSAAVICRRSALMQRLAGRGAMLSVELPAAEAGELAAAYGDGVCVAAENGPSATVLAGDTDTLERIARRLDEQGTFCRIVRVNVASHSPLMDEIADDLRAALRELRPLAPHTPMFSTTRCVPVEGGDLDAAYWQENLRRPVRFREAVETAAKAGNRVFIEVSPHPVLVHAVRDIEAAGGLAGTGVPTLLKEQDGTSAAVRALGRAFALGVPVAWHRFHGAAATGADRDFADNGVTDNGVTGHGVTGHGVPDTGAVARRVPLPLYVWDEERYAPEPAAPSAPPVSVASDASPASPASPASDGPAASPGSYGRDIALRRLGLADLGEGLAVRGLRPVPPPAYFGAVTALAQDVLPDGEFTLEEIRFGPELPQWPEALDTVARVRLTAEETPGLHRFAVGPAAEPGARPWATGLLRTAPAGQGAATDGQRALDLALTRCTEYVPGVEFYRRAEARGYLLDERLRTADRVWRRDGEAVARLAVPAAGGPAALEAGLLPVVAAWPHSGAPDAATCVYLTESVERVRLTGPLEGDAYWSVVRFTTAPGTGDAPSGGRADILLVAEDGRVAAEFTGVGMRRLAGTESAVAGPAHAPAPEVSDGPAPEVAHEPASDTVRAPAGTAPAVTVPATSVLDHAAYVLGTPANRIDLRLSLRELGLDSLMAMQLRGRLRDSHGKEVAVQRLLGKESIGDLVTALSTGSAGTGSVSTR
ncbi:type I polyketide synthase [Streptomyces sp. NPDC101160]|uniref:type I polyketide synthase n=1 Tax=Streptomyces sp. NPDC101160 TaxID=3366118 RepID=UPI00380F10F2